MEAFANNLRVGPSCCCVLGQDTEHQTIIKCLYGYILLKDESRSEFKDIKIIGTRKNEIILNLKMNFESNREPKNQNVVCPHYEK